MEGPRENPEYILQRSEVIAKLERYTQGKDYKIERELFDADGVYTLEVSVPGEKPSEKTEYLYQRKGNFPSKGKYIKNVILQTTISVTFYEDDIPVEGTSLEIYSEETGQWKEEPKRKV